ncbi:unnamed protein product [Nesidiocoris tenuis]|uniref:Uncharacterized protein n=1 Tax=Nesidiocoris tenuis TaxID=355587 RepID=A0A6H5GU29_9HEMI|nr:unnamed protein product [Nesidiocoris tenuis]
MTERVEREPPAACYRTISFHSSRGVQERWRREEWGWKSSDQCEGGLSGEPGAGVGSLGSSAAAGSCDRRRRRRPYRSAARCESALPSDAAFRNSASDESGVRTRISPTAADFWNQFPRNLNQASFESCVTSPFFDLGRISLRRNCSVDTTMTDTFRRLGSRPPQRLGFPKFMDFQSHIKLSWVFSFVSCQHPTLRDVKIPSSNLSAHRNSADINIERALAVFRDNIEPKLSAPTSHREGHAPSTALLQPLGRSHLGLFPLHGLRRLSPEPRAVVKAAMPLSGGLSVLTSPLPLVSITHRGQTPGAGVEIELSAVGSEAESWKWSPARPKDSIRHHLTAIFRNFRSNVKRWSASCCNIKWRSHPGRDAPPPRRRSTVLSPIGEYAQFLFDLVKFKLVPFDS